MRPYVLYMGMFSGALKTKVKGDPIKPFFGFVNKPGINKSHELKQLEIDNCNSKLSYLCRYLAESKHFTTQNILIIVLLLHLTFWLEKQEVPHPCCLLLAFTWIWL